VQMGHIQNAVEVCQSAAENPKFDEQTRTFFENYIQQLMGR